MPKSQGEGLLPYSKPFSRFSKYAAKKQTQRNIDHLCNHVLQLQHQGHYHAALDLSREALGAAQDRIQLFKPKADA